VNGRRHQAVSGQDRLGDAADLDGTAFAQGVVMRPFRLFALSAVTALSLACSSTQHPASLQDSFSGDVFSAFLGNPNGLSTPYVEGAKFTITVQPGGNESSTTGWKLTSSDPTVMTVGTATLNSNDWPVTATGAGHATLTVTDSGGHVLDTEGIDVDVPTQVQLCAHGLLLAGYSDTQSAVSSVRVLSGGTATFLVRYFDGSQELAGNNAVTPSSTGVASASTVAANFSVRDFLEVSAADMGSGTVTLTVGQSQTQVAVEAVDPNVVASVALAPQSENNVKDGTVLYVFARALDAQGDDVYGASFAWQVDGTPLTSQQFFVGGPTDLLSYQYKGAATETIADSLAGFTASATVHGTPATTSEGTTANVGCSVARGVGLDAGGAAMGVLAAAGLLVARRRRAGG